MTPKEQAVVEAARVFAEYEWCGEEGCPHVECHDIQRLVAALRDLDAEKCETCGGRGKTYPPCTDRACLFRVGHAHTHGLPCPTCGGGHAFDAAIPASRVRAMAEKYGRILHKPNHTGTVWTDGVVRDLYSLLREGGGR